MLVVRVENKICAICILVKFASNSVVARIHYADVPVLGAGGVARRGGGQRPETAEGLGGVWKLSRRERTTRNGEVGEGKFLFYWLCLV